MRRAAVLLALTLAACSTDGQATITGRPRDVTIQSVAPAVPAETPDTTTIPEAEAPVPEPTTVPEAPVEIPENSVANGPLPGATAEDSGGCWAIPAYVVDRETGCRNIPNSQGSGCDGYYQICAGTWAGYGGYPDALSAPKEVQDAKAAELWANGNGCAHWAAC